MISAILLAAGESRRMGRSKQLLPWRGKPLLQHVLDSLLASQVGEVILVLGFDADKIIRALSKGRARIVVNPDFRRGMSTSIRHGLLALAPASRGFLICLGDQPGIGKDIVNRLIQAFDQHFPQKSIIVPTFRGSWGHPVLFGIQYRDEALALQGDRGCRPLLETHPEHLQLVEVGTPAILSDIDTPCDFEEFTNSKGREEPE